MKARRHHNNRGDRQVRTGKTRDQVERMAQRLGVPAYHAQLGRGDYVVKSIMYPDGLSALLNADGLHVSCGCGLLSIYPPDETPGLPPPGFDPPDVGKK